MTTMHATMDGADANLCLIGPSSLDDWLHYQRETKTRAALQVVLLAHPRDELDLPRLLPWSAGLTLPERRKLTRIMTPVFGEIVKTPALNAGILFLPLYADEMLHPRARPRCRQMLEQQALEIAAQAGAGVVCLGGLTATLSQYGRRLLAKAAQLGIEITTGHAMTAVSVLRTYLRALDELALEPQHATMAVLGLGSIGGAFCRLLARQPRLPGRLLLIEAPSREAQARQYAAELQRQTGMTVEVELTLASGQLAADSAAYAARFIISAVGTANAIDIERVAPGTVLVDDGQPPCWSREAAWVRVMTRADIAPCEAGLVDCASIGYRSRFWFDFAEQNANGESSTAWSCMAEGLLRTLAPDLPSTIGEPSEENLLRYDQAFQTWGLKVPALQCGQHKLPIAALRASGGWR